MSSLFLRYSEPFPLDSYVRAKLNPELHCGIVDLSGAEVQSQMPLDAN